MHRLFHARMASWLFASLILLVLIVVSKPHMLGLVLFKLTLITSAAWLAYWIDRKLFPYARPDAFLERPCSLGGGYCEKQTVRPGHELAFSAAMQRRAILIGAAMIAAALGS